MDDDDDKSKVDPLVSEFIMTESSWSEFDDDASILNDFGWNFQTQHHEFDRIDPVSVSYTSTLPVQQTTSGSTRPAAAIHSSSVKASGDASVCNPSVSSSSSEDRPEISTAAGEASDAKQTVGNVKKKVQKRIRQQRFAFMTKSEVDHLEDGYRWRKYGQKAVKNSPFPRSYFRCTNGKCTVKKRVERSSEDPTVVITTYEGQHCHHSVGFPRILINHEAPYLRQSTPSTSQFNYPRNHFSQSSSLSITQPCQASSEAGNHTHEPPPASSQVQPDQGLLGDIVPPIMRNL